MAETTEKYGLRTPSQNDFFDVKDVSENMEKLEEALTEFDDSGTVEDIKSFPDFLTKLVTGNKLAVTIRNLKAGLQFVLHAGSIVNNCVTDNASLPLSAAQGKILKDLYTQLYSDLSKFQIGGSGNSKSVIIRKNDNDSDFAQLYATEDMLELGTQVNGVWKSIWKAAFKSDFIDAIVYRGVLTGDLDRASSDGIETGYYTIRAADTVSNAPNGAAWCTFVQFSGDYRIQLIIQPNFLAVRRYAGSPVQWIGWSKYNES